MADEPIIRPIEAGEEESVGDLVRRVFDRFVAPDFPEEGIREFLRYAHPSELARRCREGQLTLVAEVRGELAGVIEMRDLEHVAMLFVERPGRGLGRKLFETALGMCRDRRPELTSISVYSSRYAVKAYERLGFRVSGEEQTKNGIIFIPMRLSLEPAED
jgi:GNAT superfamily N-acetyltransferase